MKMIDTETGHEMVEVSGHDKKEYASKGVAGTGLGLGIAGTALWLLSGGLGGGLFGNRMGAAGAVAAGVEKEDKCELINGMWSLAFNGQTARCNDRHQIEADMNGPTFNIGYDPILSNPFPQMVDYSKEIDERVQYLQAMKERMSNTVQPVNNPNNSLWSAIDSEIGSLNDEQRNILFSDAKYIQIDNQLKQLIQEALINSVKNVIEQSPNGKELLTQQLNYVKSSKNAIIAESNKKLELFEKFQIAAKANPNLTYKEFCESINK